MAIHSSVTPSPIGITPRVRPGTTKEDRQDLGGRRRVLGGFPNRKAGSVRLPCTVEKMPATKEASVKGKVATTGEEVDGLMAWRL